MSAAATLRRAAKLMRERAETALCDGGSVTPWQVAERAACGCCDAVRDGSGDLIAHVDDRQSAHVASWHPGVAKAVAGWLDRFAEPLYCYGPVEFDAALAVARAYLGETGDGR